VICLSHSGCISRGNCLGYFDRGGACRFDGGPCTHTNGCQECRAERTTFLCRKQFYGTPVYVGLDLPPQRAVCTAAAQPDAGYWNAEFFEQGEGVAQAERNAFHHRTHTMGASMRGGESYESCPRLGVEMRRALAEEIWRPEEPVAARLNLCRLSG